MTAKFEIDSDVGIALAGRVVAEMYVGSGSMGSGGELPEPTQFTYCVELDGSQEIEIMSDNPLVLRIPKEYLTQID